MPRWFALPQHDMKAEDGGHTTYDFGCAKSGNHRDLGQIVDGEFWNSFVVSLVARPF